MGIKQPIQKGVGIIQGEITTRGPIAQEEFLEIDPILQKYLLVGPLTLKNPLGLQALHLMGERGRDIARTIHMGNLRRQSFLHLMVR